MRSFRNESEFNRWFTNCCIMCNAKVFVCVGNKWQTPGWPDRFISHSRIPGGVWVEGKKDNGVLRTDQKIVIADLLEHGSNVVIARYLSKGHKCVIEEAWRGAQVASFLIANNKPDGQQGLAFIEALLMGLDLES